MLYTVISLNPCIDRILTLKTPLNENALNRIAQSEVYPAGKGVNVARVLRRLVKEDDEVSLYTFLGEESISLFSEVTEKEGIRLHVLPTEKPTRSCYKLMSPKNCSSDLNMTELNESGGPYGEAELCALAEAAASVIENGSNQIVCLCGSIPQGVEKGVYNWLISLFKSCGIMVFLDCDGEALRKGVESAPFLIKPNFFEFCGLAEQQFSTYLQAVEFAAALSVEKAVAVLCTNGDKGSFLAKDGNIWQVSCPTVEAACPAGAGDHYLAGFAAAIGAGKTIEEALQWGASAAAAKVETEGSLIPKVEELCRRRSDITVEKENL